LSLGQWIRIVLMQIRGGGGRSAKNVHPLGKILGTGTPLPQYRTTGTPLVVLEIERNRLFITYFFINNMFKEKFVLFS
jgi:hypothetical protein